MCLPLWGEMLLLTLEMSSSAHQWQMNTFPASLRGRLPRPQALLCSCLAEPRPTNSSESAVAQGKAQTLLSLERMRSFK